MTEQRAIWLLSQMYLPHFEEEEKQAISKAIESLEILKALKNTVDDLEDKLKIYVTMKNESEDKIYQDKYHIKADELAECIGKIKKLYQ